MMEEIEEYTKIESIFIRHRNFLLVRGNFSPLFTDFYLNAMQYKIQLDTELTEILKELLAYFTLYLVNRPWAEQYAWTVLLPKPHASFFVTGSSTSEQIIGRYFDKDIKATAQGILFSQFIQEGKEPRTSTIQLKGANPSAWVEKFYKQSEQRNARSFYLGNDSYALICAQPDSDDAWLDSLSVEDVKNIQDSEETKVLETRKFKFECGCTREKILPILGNWKNKKDELFGDQKEIEIVCPRCAAKYYVEREDL